MTLGNAAAARVRLIVWCKSCGHQIEPDPAEMADRYGARTPVPDWRARLVCGQCGSRQVDLVVSGGSSTSDMRPQPVTAAAYHVPADRPLLISRCCAQPRGDLVVPNVPPVHGRGRLMGKESYGLPRRPIDAANAPGTCIMTPARTSANNGVPLASWRPRRSLPNPTLE